MGALQYNFWLVVYYIALLVTGIIAFFEAIVIAVIGDRYDIDYYVARTFKHFAQPIMGWYFDVTGEEHIAKGTGPAVLLGNHQSALDILYLGSVFPRRAAIMAKKEIKWIPGLGWFMMLSGSIFINRSNRKSAVQAMNEAGAEMKRKQISLWIFPEGTRHMSDEPELLPFKKGAFHLAVQSGLPIVPVVCENYHKLKGKGKYFKRGTLKVKILPPVPTTGLTSEDIPALIDKVRNQMLTTLKEISQPAPEPSSTTPSPEPFVDSEEDEDAQETVGKLIDTADSESETVIDTEDQVPLVPNKNGDGKVALAMVSDFFYPDVGGVEGHIYSLSVELARRGHRVIVITHHRPSGLFSSLATAGDGADKRVGIRYLAPGIKVYHLPFITLASSASLPNYLSFLPFFRSIILREGIQLIHGHGTLSSLAHEAIHHGPLFGVRTVFTDHSLFGFADAVGVLTNKLLASALRNVDAVICVSNTGRENTALRAEIEPERVSVIPNALVPSQFEPDPLRVGSEITIVVISRLVYRKGIDLLVASAPTICSMFPDVRFVVGGDGPKMVDLLQMREKYELQDRVELLGPVKPADVRGVLTRGHIYLNTSLTESFGISIIEAACVGLFVVATRVGGVPEILPADMIEFARADEDGGQRVAKLMTDVIRALSQAIHTIRKGRHDARAAHARVRNMYSWASVAERTEKVYERVLASKPLSTWDRLVRLRALGPVFGAILCIIIAVQGWYLLFLELVAPADEIDPVTKHWDAQVFSDTVEREKRHRS